MGVHLHAPTSATVVRADGMITDVASALAATDPDRAERIRKPIPSGDSKTSALNEVARALAATDPDRAERIPRSIPGKRWKARALVTVTESLK